MSEVYLDIVDMVRVMAGLIVCRLIFVAGAADRRDHFVRRLVRGCLVLAVWTMIYVPFELAVELLSGEWLALHILLIGIWWLATGFITIWFVWSIYDITVSNVFFRCLMGSAVNEIATLIVRYVVNTMWMPGLDEKRPVLYIMITAAVYAAAAVLFYLLLGRRMRDSGHDVITTSRYNVIYCIITIVVLTLSTDLTSAVLEYSIQYSEGGSPEQYFINATLIPWFCIIILFVICVIILFNQYSTFRMLQQKQEKELLQQLEQEKAHQYEFTKENIDLINHKCHDLKYRIQALKLAEGSEKEKLVEDVTRDIRFYDASIQTDNPTLNTILTEKSLVCTGAGIRFSCSAETAGLERIEVVDLYTMLGNALDNAIEHVRRYDDPDKKTISLSIRKTGSMVHIIVDNYYEGELEIRDGFPVTGKADKRYHGFGIKSINMIAKRYGGDSEVSASGSTFSLHIMIPA